MPAFNVAGLSALEILDSRGRPTLAVTVRLADGTTARAGVPSGASTGSREAVERRDGDPDRYEGKGVLGAVAAVNTEIRDLLRSRSWASLAEADQAMIDLDGTPNKGRLGANATVGVSMALARALAASAGAPLWEWLTPQGVTPSLPVPHFNVLNGGVHAPNALDFQEFMVAPVGAPSMAEAVRAGAEVYSALRRELTGRKLSTGLGDEGGFAPEITEPEEVLRILVQAISDAGYKPGADGVSIALDLAASEFRQPDGRYQVAGDLLSSGDMIERLAQITRQFPVHLIEDGLGEDDDDGWIALTARLGATTELVGDDIFCTNPAIITAAIERGIGNSALIKLNQIGTVTETLQAMAICRRAGYRQFVSHRSGETEDHFIADLAVGTGCGHLKTGAPARGERVAKYNRLLEIAASAPSLRYGMPGPAAGRTGDVAEHVTPTPRIRHGTPTCRTCYACWSSLAASCAAPARRRPGRGCAGSAWLRKSDRQNLPSRCETRLPGTKKPLGDDMPTYVSLVDWTEQGTSRTSRTPSGAQRNSPASSRGPAARSGWCWWTVRRATSSRSPSSPTTRRHLRPFFRLGSAGNVRSRTLRAFNSRRDGRHHQPDRRSNGTRQLGLSTRPNALGLNSRRADLSRPCGQEHARRVRSRAEYPAGLRSNAGFRGTRLHHRLVTGEESRAHQDALSAGRPAM